MVNFPGLHLSFNINPVAVNIFGIDIYYYAIFTVLAIAVTLILCYKSKDNFNIEFDFLLSSLLVALVFGFIGARLYYVLFNLKVYLASPLKIFNIRDRRISNLWRPDCWRIGNCLSM